MQNEGREALRFPAFCCVANMVGYTISVLICEWNVIFFDVKSYVILKKREDVGLYVVILLLLQTDNSNTLCYENS
jgi:hypothetical protein